MDANSNHTTSQSQGQTVKPTKVMPTAAVCFLADKRNDTIQITVYRTSQWRTYDARKISPYSHIRLSRLFARYGFRYTGLTETAIAHSECWERTAQDVKLVEAYVAKRDAAEGEAQS